MAKKILIHPDFPLPDLLDELSAAVLSVGMSAEDAKAADAALQRLHSMVVASANLGNQTHLEKRMGDDQLLLVAPTVQPSMWSRFLRRIFRNS